MIYRYWTSEELEILSACNAQRVGIDGIAKILGRTRHSIEGKRRYLKMTYPPAPPKPEPELPSRPIFFVADIQRSVAEHFKIPVAEMKSPCRARDYARPRQVAMYLARELTVQSLTDIGRRFGGRDHTTVLHGVRQVERLISEDVALFSRVSALKSKICASLVDKSHLDAFATESAGA